MGIQYVTVKIDTTGLYQPVTSAVPASPAVLVVRSRRFVTLGDLLNYKVGELVISFTSTH